MAKDPSPKADGLQAMREARYGHIQAKAEPPRTDQGIKPWVTRSQPVKPTMGRPPADPKAPAKRKLIPYAGQISKGEAPSGPRTEAAKARASAAQEDKKARKRLKHKRRTALPEEDKS